APEGMNPQTHEREGVRTNHDQMTPYSSADCQKFMEFYEDLVGALQELFDFIRQCLQHYFPEEVVDLEMSISQLPNHRGSAVHPFASIAINFNVMTRLHRDVGDTTWCACMPLGSFLRGDLCLMEQGLVLPMRGGDLIFFRSRSDTHFNLPY
ncbi:hypothetical protein PENSPDRAFT_556557, partial [Peniophora sp. CONT]